MSQDTTSNKRKSITLSALVIGTATFLSRIAGLLREQTFAYLFGAGIWTDAFNVAFRIPNLLRDLFAEGAMSSAFVPTFNSILEKEGHKKAFRLTNLTFCAILSVAGLLTILGIIFTPEIVNLIAPEFASDPVKYDVTVTMTRIMFPFLILVSFAAISMGILNSLGDFFIPAFAPAFFNLSMIASGWLICPIAVRFGMPAITGMAIGALLGGTVQFLVQVPFLYKHGFRFNWHLSFKDPGIRKIIKLIIPATVGMAATQINIAVSTILATSQGDGAVSWLTFSFRLMQLPLGLFGVAVAQATLPVVSRQAALKDNSAVATTLIHSIRLTSFINLFACFFIFAQAEPLIRLLFERGQFTAQDTLATATALRAYCFGLVFFCLVKVMAPSFYALNNTKIPVAASITAVLVNIIMNLILVRPFGYWGLALGTSLGALINSGILYCMLQIKLGGFFDYKLIFAYFKILIATFTAGITSYYSYLIVSDKLESYKAGFETEFFGTTIALTLCFCFSVFVLATISYLLKIEEAQRAQSLVLRKIGLKK